MLAVVLVPEISIGGGRMMGILIVDDNAQLREALRTELEAQNNIRILGEAADGMAAVQLA